MGLIIEASFGLKPLTEIENNNGRIKITASGLLGKAARNSQVYAEFINISETVAEVIELDEQTSDEVIVGVINEGKRFPVLRLRNSVETN